MTNAIAIGQRQFRIFDNFIMAVSFRGFVAESLVRAGKESSVSK